jgi:hypothetical protein
VSDWLELELSHDLAPVEAPGELWDRVRPGARREPRRGRVWTAWPMAAVIMILIAVGTLLLVAKGEQPAPATRHLAQEQPRTHDASCLTCHTNL